MGQYSGFHGDFLRGNATTMVLAILCEGPTHGYAISHEIQRRSEDLIHFKPSSLYPLLHGLESDGLLTSDWETANTSRPRRIYVITPAGREALVARLEEYRRYDEAMAKITWGVQRGGS